MEKSILAGAAVAVHEINACGGVLGEELTVAVFDDRSEVASTARGIDHLCRDESVDVIVGGYTSASRFAMRPAIHANRSLLMYPTYFEGEESDSRVFYCGAAPNQYLTDYLGWIASTLGRRVYIVGSDTFTREFSARRYADSERIGTSRPSVTGTHRSAKPPSLRCSTTSGVNVRR